MNKNKTIKFTNHARSRMEQFNIEENKAYGMIKNGTAEDAPNRKAYAENKNTEYIRWGSIIFTGIHTNDNKSGKEIFLIVTIYDQRMDLRQRRY